MNFAEQRAVMVRRQLKDRGLTDKRVLKAMADIPREEFVPENLKELAYEDGPLPIGNGQTISQPYVVALMCELLKLSKEARVLDVGAGSGYQTAVLSLLAREVYAVEIVPELARKAQSKLKALGLDNAKVVIGDGKKGLSEKAPFDAIVCAAATRQVPDAWKDQLKENGRLVLPIKAGLGQELIRFTKLNHSFKEENFGGVAFVLLV